ncbi:hypothetical protein BDN67DRAFT_940190 [Paxillus ammoniavirescens]|nr:hypothetical protein BDN67DRAFT_940190 [Paxillus ammoniavirescens]
MAHVSALSSPSPLSPPPKSTQSWKETFITSIKDISDDPSHPVQISMRTYILTISLSLGPTLLPVALALRSPSLKGRIKVFWRVLERELGPTGFASAMTVAVGGGAALQRLWDILCSRDGHHRSEDTQAESAPSPPPVGDRSQSFNLDLVYGIYSKLSQYQRAFLANVLTSTLAIILLQRRRRRRIGPVSPMMNLSLLFLVRALDASVQSLLFRKAREVVARRARLLPHLLISGPSGDPVPFPDTISLNKQPGVLAQDWQRKVATRLDALIFWASSARFVRVHWVGSSVLTRLLILDGQRIMWCFFYQPQRLSSSYVKWINSLARADRRLLEVLRAVQEGTWSYIYGSTIKRDIVCTLAEELGHPPSWGDPVVLPAYGGRIADAAWKKLGVHGRNGVGGLPCNLVHGGVNAKLGLDDSCVANAAERAAYAFVKALVIYLPVHFLPLLLTRPSSIIRLHGALPPFLSAVRGASFLSTFVSSFWLATCFTRTLVLARLFPNVSHDIWDGSYGCILAGSLVCGASIWIENPRRRGELALYVLPKALKTFIPERLLNRGHPVARFSERIAFVLSLASLLTFGLHHPESLRGLSRWTLAFVMKGPDVGFWKKRKKEIATCPPTPVDPSMLPTPSASPVPEL